MAHLHFGVYFSRQTRLFGDGSSRCPGLLGGSGMAPTAGLKSSMIEARAAGQQGVEAEEAERKAGYQVDPGHAA